MIASRHNCILDLFECCFKWFKKQDGCKTCDVWNGKWLPCPSKINKCPLVKDYPLETNLLKKDRIPWTRKKSSKLFSALACRSQISKVWCNNPIFFKLLILLSPKERDLTTTRPLWLYCIACDWSSIEHSHINRACTTTFTDPDSFEPLANTIPSQSFQDGISKFRFSQKFSANTSVQPPRTSNKGLTSICLRPRSPPETDHSNLLISCISFQTALSYNLIPYSIRFFPNSGASSFLVANATEENQQKLAKKLWAPAKKSSLPKILCQRSPQTHLFSSSSFHPFYLPPEAPSCLYPTPRIQPQLPLTSTMNANSGATMHSRRLKP